MGTRPSDIAASLEDALVHSSLNRTQLAGQAGITPLTLRKVLGGQDYRLSTLLSVADTLGLDVVLVPRTLSHALGAQPAGLQPARDVEPAARPRTVLDQALARLGRYGRKDGA